MPSNKFNRTGIVIKLTPAKDQDLVVTLLLDSGAIATIYCSKGRSGKSKRARALDLLNHVKVSLQQSPNSSLAQLNEIVLISSMRPHIESLQGLIAIQLACEVVNQLMTESVDDPGTFIQLQDLRQLINNDNNVLLVAAFILKLVDHLGFLPEINIDVISQAPINQGDNRILAPEIGYTTSGVVSGVAVSDRLYKVQRLIIGSPLSDVIRVGLSLSEQVELLRIHVMWLNFITQRKLNSADLFISTIKL